MDFKIHAGDSVSGQERGVGPYELSLTAVPNILPVSELALAKEEQSLRTGVASSVAASLLSTRLLNQPCSIGRLLKNEAYREGASPTGYIWDQRSTQPT